MNRIVLLGALLLPVLTACTSLPPVAPDTRAARSAATLTDWEVRGRVAVKRGEKGGQATLVWVHRDRQHDIRLNGPLGRGLLTLQHNASEAWVTDSRGQRFTDVDAESLLLRLTGWRIPFASLDYWARGLVVPDAPHQLTRDGAGRLATLVQGGWSVRFIDYTRVDGMDLPRRLEVATTELVGTDEPIQTEARIVIDQWITRPVAP